MSFPLALVFLAPAGESDREAGEGEKRGIQGRGRDGQRKVERSGGEEGGEEGEAERGREKGGEGFCDLIWFSS